MLKQLPLLIENINLHKPTYEQPKLSNGKLSFNFWNEIKSHICQRTKSINPNKKKAEDSASFHNLKAEDEIEASEQSINVKDVKGRALQG